MKYPDRKSRKVDLGVALCRAVLACGALGLLTSCQSPMQSDVYEKNWGRYADSLLTRAVADGSLAALPAAGPTDNQGIHELASVAAADGSGAVVPAGDALTNSSTGVVGTQGAGTQPASTEPALLGETENVTRLSLEDAIARTLQHSLAIKVEAYNPGIKEAQITEALAALDPVFFGQSQFNNQDEPVPLVGTSNGVNWNNSIGIKQLLPSGGTAQIGVGDTYRDFQEKNLITPNSSHEANINLTLSQPLLRGFGSNVTLANTYLAQRDQRIALTQFRRQVIQSVADVEEAYLNLILARSAADIQERLLANTEDTYKKILARQPVDADRVQIKEAEAAVQARNAELVQAKTAVRDASDKLKSLMNDPEIDLRSGVLVVPSDRPIDVPMAFNIGEQMDVALRQRTELQEARLQIQRSDIIVDVARNDLLPRADLTVSTQSNGFDDSIETAFSQTYDAPKLIDYIAGLKLEIPMGNRQAESVFRRRLLERRQAVTQMLRIAQQVILDVKTQMRAILTSYSLIQLRQSARIAAGEELNAIIIQEAVQRLSPEFLRLKLDSQQRLANAELDELQALVNYNLAIMRLEQAKGTLLEYNRIAIDKPPAMDEGTGQIRFLGKTYDYKAPK